MLQESSEHGHMHLRLFKFTWRLIDTLWQRIKAHLPKNSEALTLDIQFSIAMTTQRPCLVRKMQRNSQLRYYGQARIHTNSQSLLKLMPFESMMPSNHLILCDPFSSCLQSFPASGSFPMSSSSHQVAKVFELKLRPQSFQWIFTTDFL